MFDVGSLEDYILVFIYESMTDVDIGCNPIERMVMDDIRICFTEQITEYFLLMFLELDLWSSWSDH